MPGRRRKGNRGGGEQGDEGQRGRGRGAGGRGGFRGRFGGGGGRGSPQSRGRGRGRGGTQLPGWSLAAEEIEFTTRLFGNQTPGTPNRGQSNSGANTPSRGRGSFDHRGRGQSNFYQSPRRGDFGIGASPRGGRGRGGQPSRLRPDAPLSGLLYQERPLLRPIIFVPSVYTKVLFQEEEEIFLPVVEETNDTEKSHIPTADRVFRVFSGGDIPPMSSSSEDEDDGDVEEIEEVDFNDIGKLFESESTSKTKTTTKVSKRKLESAVISTEQFTGFYVDTRGSTEVHEERVDITESIIQEPNVDELTKMMEETLSAADEPPEQQPTSTPDVEMGNSDGPVVSQLPPVFQDPAIVQVGHHRTPSNHSVFSPPSMTSDVAPTLSQQNYSAEPMIVTESTTIDPPSSDIFIIDVDPSPVPPELAAFTNQPPEVLASPTEDDDIIVYVAPHPRRATEGQDELQQGEQVSSNVPDTSYFEAYDKPGSLASAIQSTSLTPSAPGPEQSSQLASSIPEPPSVSSVSFAFTKGAESSGTGTPQRLRLPPVTTPRLAKAWQRKRGLTTHSKKGKKKGKSLKGRFSSFGSFGALHEEAMLHESDPKWENRRRGDSDLEWGDEDDDDDTLDDGPIAKGKGKAKASLSIAELEAEEHGMEVDEDFSGDLAAMQSFVSGMLGSGSGAHKTMDDIRDEEMMRREDEEGLGGTSDEDEDSDENENEDEDSEVERIIATEEAMMISETFQFSEDDDDDDDDENVTPRRSFQARLERLRRESRKMKKVHASFEGPIDGDDDDDDDDDDFFHRNMTWADADDDFIAQIEDILDENEDILNAKDRKARKKLLRDIDDGLYDNDSSDDDNEGFRPAPRKRDKGKHLPPELRALWERDRKKKAETKKQRELARLEAAADPMAKKKGGRKGKKAMLVAASLDPTITVIPNRVIDFTTLVQQIKRFVADVGGPSTISLPPADKWTRKNVHEIAQAYGLKSVSKGKGEARYTTLAKTTKTGYGVNETKVAKILRKTGSLNREFVRDGRGTAPRVVMPKHKEGEVVGKAAPKISNSNVGFKMLAMMGWSDGDRIGATGGLAVPLTAVIKHTKLGLGATK